jgi:hypothetical protein
MFLYTWIVHGIGSTEVSDENPLLKIFSCCYPVIDGCLTVFESVKTIPFLGIVPFVPKCKDTSH